MRLFIIEKKEIILCCCVLAAGILTVSLLFNGVSSINTLSKGRMLPVYCVGTEKKQIALTFDAAWGNSDTDLILKTLDRHGAKATFFCTGEWVSKYPDDLSRIYAAGHVIANHSDAHRHIASMTSQELADDIKTCNEKILAVTGKGPLLYRGPYGEYNNALLCEVQKLNMFAVQWDIDSRDWQKKKTAAEMAQFVCERAKCGSIILFHTDTPETPEAIDLMLKKLKGDGYSFVTAEELIYKKDFTIDSLGCQHKNA